MGSELKGFCHPFTPGGRSQLVGPPPWHFSVEQMVIDYEADEDLVTQYIPRPLGPSANMPAGCAVRITAMTSVSDGESEMIAINPERSIFNEAIVYTNCSYQGTEGQKIAYMWVDNDFTLFRGWLMGTPKKLGRIKTNFERRHVYGLNPGLQEFGTGTKLRGWTEAHGERLLDAGMTLTRRVEPQELPASLKREIYNIVYVPNIEIGATKPLAHRLVTVVAEAKLHEMWEGTDVKLVFGESETEDHTDIAPRRIKSACFMTLSLTIRGNKLLYDYNQ
jgi:acetoacetate decarboxylase